MHELSLAQALLDLAQKNAQGKRILALRVRVGALSGVVTDSLSFAFEMISRGTPAEGARLDFRARASGDGLPKMRANRADGRMERSARQ